MLAKLSALVFSTLLLLQSMGLNYDDLVRLDELFEHASYHQQQYGDNIITFLSKHYGDQKEAHQRDHQEEQDDHRKLPFQQQQCQQHLAPVFLGQLVMGKSEASHTSTDRKSSRGFYYSLNDYDAHSQAVFQPPRRA